jgi:BirA family transcriptional regulator, biotin operon repressor / biotin---[acetyl-CoA-carboxylase] ligase
VTGNSAWPSGYAIRHFDEIDSTNDEARRLAQAGEQGPVWILADLQTKGRGRRGRVWHSPIGNLAASLFLRPEKSAAECAQLSFLSALAVADTIGRYAASSDVRVKWPNDVLADDRKIAGILLESASAAGNRLDWLAIGIGINLAEHPEDTEFPATSLNGLGIAPPSSRDTLGLLATSWARWYDVWMTRGFEPIRDAWLARAARLGTRIRARLQDEEIFGLFEGIDETGALILRESQNRTRHIAAGEVFF